MTARRASPRTSPRPRSRRPTAAAPAHTRPALLPYSLAEFKRASLRAYLTRQLDASAGCVSELARLVGHNRTDLYKLMRRLQVPIARIRAKHGLEPRNRKPAPPTSIEQRTLTDWLAQRVPAEVRRLRRANARTPEARTTRARQPAAWR